MLNSNIGFGQVNYININIYACSSSNLCKSGLLSWLRLRNYVKLTDSMAESFSSVQILLVDRSDILMTHQTAKNKKSILLDQFGFFEIALVADRRRPVIMTSWSPHHDLKRLFSFNSLMFLPPQGPPQTVNLSPGSPWSERVSRVWYARSESQPVHLDFSAESRWGERFKFPLFT